MVTQDFEIKKGITVTQGPPGKDKANGQKNQVGSGGKRPQTSKGNGKSVVPRQGCGKYDLDTGLSKETRAIIRNRKSNKQRHLNEFQKYVNDKNDPHTGTGPK